MLSLSAVPCASRTWLPDALSALARPDVRVVVVVRTSPDSKLAATLQTTASRVVILNSPGPGWQAKILGGVEHALGSARQLAAVTLGWRAGLFNRRRLSERLKLEERLAELHARRLEAAASSEADGVFEDVDPDLFFTAHPDESEELPLLAAAYTRRIRVIAFATERAAINGIRMPAARFARIIVPDGGLAEPVVRHGAHPFEVTVVGRATSARSAGQDIAEVILEELGLGSKVGQFDPDPSGRAF